jgi:hypothetical protein
MFGDGGALHKARHRDQRSMRDADQAELAALRHGAALVDEGTYDDLVAGAMDDFEQGTDEAIQQEFHTRDLAEDAGTGRTQEMVERRQELLGDLYPFRLEDNRLVHNGEAVGLYEFLLTSSVQTDIMSKPFNRIPQVFERVAAVLSTGLLGPGASSLHVGAPRDKAVGTSFKSAIAKLHELTGEWNWRPDDDLPPGGPPTGDDGLDFVAWLDTDADRPGRLFLIGQCACGDDWTDKFDELSLNRLGEWTGHSWKVKPTKLFAAPHVIADGHFVRAQKRAGLLLDRVRLCRLASNLKDPDVLAPFRAEMADLTKLVLGE